MLVAKASRKATSWLFASSSASQLTATVKGKASSSLLKRYSKIRVPVTSKIFTRTVITLADDSSDTETGISHISDLRGLDSSVEMLTGVPASQLHRKVLIYKPTPKTVSSGKKHTLVYMKFQRQGDRVNESLMGWTATSDPTGNLTLSFQNDHSAIAFAQRNGLEYELRMHEGQDREREARDYAVNFKFRDPKAKHNEDFDL